MASSVQNDNSQVILPPAIELGPDLEPWEIYWACVNMDFVTEILSTPSYGIIHEQSALPVSEVRYEESVRDVLYKHISMEVTWRVHLIGIKLLI